MNLNESQQKEQRLYLKEFLKKITSLGKLLDRSDEQKLSQETRENIEWYCDYRVHQYYKKYLNYLEWEKGLEKRRQEGVKKH